MWMWDVRYLLLLSLCPSPSLLTLPHLPPIWLSHLLLTTGMSIINAVRLLKEGVRSSGVNN